MKETLLSDKIPIVFGTYPGLSHRTQETAGLYFMVLGGGGIVVWELYSGLRIFKASIILLKLSPHLDYYTLCLFFFLLLFNPRVKAKQKHLNIEYSHCVLRHTKKIG